MVQAMFLAKKQKKGGNKVNPRDPKNRGEDVKKEEANEASINAAIEAGEGLDPWDLFSMGLFGL